MWEPPPRLGWGGGEAELLEWVGPCQFNIRLGAVRRARGPYLRGRKTAQSHTVILTLVQGLLQISFPTWGPLTPLITPGPE